MISLNIFTDFCSSWLIWWIAPFFLGLLLGASIWRRHQVRTRELEEEVARHKTQVHNLSSALKQCKAKSEKDNILISEQAKLLRDSKKQLESNLGTSQRPSSSTAAVLGSGKILDKSKSSKGDYSKLQRTNLQIIEGIGPKLEIVLKENGIKNWKDLSSRSYGELRAILDKYGGRYAIVDPTSWPKQATLAKNEKWEKLMQLQGEGGTDSKFKKILQKLDIL